MNVAQNNTTAEHVAESDVLRHVSGGEWRFPNKAMKLSASVYAAEVIGQKDRRVSWCYGCTPEEALANARLMAAAKDMAEALNNLLGYFRSGNECPVDRVVIRGNCEEVVAGFAALKKAGAA